MLTDDSDQPLKGNMFFQEKRTDLALERNRLANVRTYLAWTRTGLASVGGGLAIIKWLTFSPVLHQRASQITGVVLVVLGISIFIMSWIDFKRGQLELPTTYQYSSSIAFITTLSLTLSAVSLVLLLLAFQ